MMPKHDQKPLEMKDIHFSPSGLGDLTPVKQSKEAAEELAAIEVRDADPAQPPCYIPPVAAEPLITPDPASPTVLETLTDELTSRLDALDARLENAFIQRDGFDRLYDDFDRCRKQESLALVLPWINGLIRLHDNIGKTRDALVSTDAPDPGAKLAEHHLAGVQEELEVLLGNNGVTLYREADDRFTSRRQSVIDLVQTANADDDGLIAARVRPGFELGERLLRKERVRVYKHRAESAPEMPDATQETLPKSE